MDPGGKNSTEERDAPDAKKHFLAALWRNKHGTKTPKVATHFSPQNKHTTRAEAESENFSQLKKQTG